MDDDAKKHATEDVLTLGRHIEGRLNLAARLADLDQALRAFGPDNPYASGFSVGVYARQGHSWEVRAVAPQSVVLDVLRVERAQLAEQLDNLDRRLLEARLAVEGEASCG